MKQQIVSHTFVKNQTCAHQRCLSVDCTDELITADSSNMFGSDIDCDTTELFGVSH